MGSLCYFQKSDTSGGGGGGEVVSEKALSSFAASVHNK